MIHIFKSKRDNKFIVYDDIDFKQHHTHVNDRTTAEIIKRNVTKLRIPNSKDTHFLISHIRLSINDEYTTKLTNLIKSVNPNVIIHSENKGLKKDILNKIEQLAYCSTSLLYIGPKETTGLVAKIKNIIKGIPLDLDVNYLFNKSCFVISYKDSINNKEFSLEIYQNFSYRLIMINIDGNVTNKKYNNISVDKITNRIKIFMEGQVNT